jgi:hypothetical protein
VRHAVERLRELVQSGELSAYLAAEKKTGEPMLGEARTLFASLPAVTPATSAEEIVELGLWPALPHNLRRAFESPRYRLGRELFVRTTVSHQTTDRCRPVGSFDPGGAVAFSHRGELRGRAGDMFVVAIDGASSPLRFSRSDILAWNEPTPVPLASTLSGVQVDYNDPLLKAHVCAAYLELGPAALKLDFGADEAVTRELQVSLIRRVSARVRMSYAGRGEGYAGARAGALLSGGQGVCFVQRAAAMALLAPFARSLAFELQAAVGRTLRLGVPHGFAVVTLRPSLRRYIVDPAWGEPLTDLRVAFFGPGWGHDRRLERLEGTPDTRVPPEAIDLPEVVTP